jgi:hypothetical protein
MAKKRHHPKRSQFTPEVWIALINQVGMAVGLGLLLTVAFVAPNLAQDGIIVMAIAKAMNLWAKV